MSKTYFKITATSLFLFLFLVSCTEQKSSIEPPKVVGIPPQNAYTGLVMLDDGEIRHYGPDLYITTKDQGVSWDTIAVADGNLYGKKDPLSGEYIRVFAGKDDAVFAVRSIGGIDGEWTKNQIDNNGAIMIKPVVFIKNGKRAIAAFHTLHRNGSGTYYSDDGGINWKKSNQVNSPPHQAHGIHKGQRWNHGGVEPSVVELQDGRLWMLIRTAQDNLYESFSEDSGESWSTAVPSRFYGTITMATIQRLQNGSLLLLWNNTTPLPEVEHDGGYWEDVFTNRDALHAAISDDDGQTWSGFREIYLNPLRNDSLMATRFGEMGSNDRSVQQTEFVELNKNKILISLGQHPKFRKLLTLDLNWLREKERYDDFADGLAHWSHHSYIKGIKGHCAYDRKPGALLIPHPNKDAGQVMHLKTKKDTSLVSQQRGALFNFPAGQKGEIVSRIKINKGFKGMLISLHDRWFNPTDTTSHHFAMYNFKLEENQATPDTWQILRLEWDNTDTQKPGYCSVYIDDKKLDPSIPLQNNTINGISYIKFSLPAEKDDNEGVLIESIKTIVD